MNENVVDSSYLYILLENIKKQKNELNKYKSMIHSIINSNGVLKNKLHNYETFKLKIDKSFNEYEQKINNMINIINSRIIPDYDEMNAAIKNIFESEFKNELLDLLGHN